MDRQIEATQVTNSLAYLHLLLENEQITWIKLNFSIYKKCKCKNNKRPEYNPEYIKWIKRVLHSTFDNLHEYL